MDNLCIGTAQFGMDYGIANQSGKPSQENVSEIIREASNNNIWFYDTAQAYGDSEVVLGKVFAEQKINEKVSVITKLRPDFEFDGIQGLKKLIWNSIDNLKVSQLWGLMLHRSQIKGDWDKFLDAVNYLKMEDLIQHFGVSCYSPQEAIKFIDIPEVDIMQIPFNVMDRRWPDADFFTVAENNGKTIFIRSIYLQGLLFLNDEQLKEKNMEWSISCLSQLKTFLSKNSLDGKTFVIKAIEKLLPKVKFVTGIEQKEQLVENIKIFKSLFPHEDLIDKWWDSLPVFPERLLNPSLW